MSRALSVALAVCCVLSMGVVAVPVTDSPSAPAPVPTGPTQSTTCVADPNVGCADNSSNFLSVNASDVVTVSRNDTSLDVSTAVATDVASTTRALSAETFENEYRATPPGERRAVVEKFGNELENRTADLRDRERDALRDYNDGDVSTEEYLRTLAEIDATADRLWALSFDVRDRWYRVTGQYTRDPYAGVRADLYGLRSPVRDRLQSVYAGDTDPMRVHVTTTDSGVVLAAFVEFGAQPVYLRDTYLGDVRRTSTGANQFSGPQQAQDRINELYPWAFTRSGHTTENSRGFADAYQSTAVHVYGQTTVFLDGRNGRVFADQQVTYLDRTPFRTTAETNTSNGLTVTLEQTHQGGPLNVTVTDETGERVPATVTIAAGGPQQQVVETGEDGTLWTATPYTPNLVVRAEHDGETVTIVRFARS
jgi:hypothetical protein